MCNGSWCESGDHDISVIVEIFGWCCGAVTSLPWMSSSRRWRRQRRRIPSTPAGSSRRAGCRSRRTGRLNVAGLRLAWQRRRGELTAINAVLPCVEAAARVEEDRDATSHYVLTMQDGLRRGAIEAAAYGLVQAHQDKVMGKAGSRTPRLFSPHLRPPPDAVRCHDAVPNRAYGDTVRPPGR